MKAIVWTQYGPPEVLTLKQLETPKPREGEVLIRVYASTVTAGDCELRSLKLPFIFGLPLRIYIGFVRPRENTIPGTELAGVIEAVGQGVTRFEPGDSVFGSTGMGLGANAEYICLPAEPGESEGGVAQMPGNMSYEQAATVPFGGRDALHFLRFGNLKPGDHILINGAGGSIGTFAVQLAKLEGAEVTAVDSGEKLEALRSLGADHLVDYTVQDVTAGEVRYDVIFDVVGTLSLRRANRVLKVDGTYLLANPARQMLAGLAIQISSRKRVVMQPAAGTIDDLEYLRRLIEQEKLRTIIDRRYRLEEIVDAHRYVETGQKLGNVVITMDAA